MLRVDITAAKRIYNHRVRAAQARSTEPIAADNVFEEVAALFEGFSFDNRQATSAHKTADMDTHTDQQNRQYGRSGAEVNALRVLGEATAEMTTQNGGRYYTRHANDLSFFSL